MRTIRLVAVVILALAAAGARAQGPSDADAIRQTALDYIEGWYEGNGERMARALHPELAKRILRTDAAGVASLDTMGSSTLVRYTRSGGGSKTPKDKQQKDVTVFDVFGNAASAKVVASDWIDYLHLVKHDGRWVI